MSSTDVPTSASATVFQDFDIEEVFNKAWDHVENQDSKNFVVEFSLERAQIAFDLGVDEIRELLSQELDDRKDRPVRWINVWDPSTQKDVMDAIGDKYMFSLRLRRLMTTSKSPQDESRRPKPRKRLTLRHQRTPKDLEKGDDADGSFQTQAQTQTQTTPPASVEVNDNLALYMQVKDTVNYFSTDQTQEAFVIGANWLHRRPTTERELPHRISIMPPKHWQWLALCNDHTVLSIHERPSLEAVPEKENKANWHIQEFKFMRAHTLAVLLQLSVRGFELYKNNPLAQSSVRQSLRNSPPTQPEISRHQSGVSFFNNSEIGSLPDEGTSNLFYYLFEDYVAAGPLKAAEQELEEMTHKILSSTRRKKVSKSSEIIPTLHYLSKDLREFKHLFENYKNLISKIMAVGKPDSLHNSQFDGTVLDGKIFQGKVSERKVFLTNSALSRFDRLGDRLQYLMLNTIEGYLEEIGALSTTYFNLTQQKDSQATARLTRSATLLAKLSVFFLPISFMTSYFSVQIEDLFMYWNAKTYWYAFAVIASVSFVSLFFFSRILVFFIDILEDWSARLGDWSGARYRSARSFLGFKETEDDEDL
ncbi:hypothetical protein F4821DRAFT_235398 [Hypoxylon rubiginosum]|uniref:Uncharacterized protein n=1 Tax=Hypoxylon rubiginosum TaxID=110542 RepID=A0ACC0D551_9PEZI|nr:hypothetical protein F4821DRAFT_235398 [Hypoxylon rubiginosum]